MRLQFGYAGDAVETRSLRKLLQDRTPGVCQRAVSKSTTVILTN